MSELRPAWHISQLKEIRHSLNRARALSEEQGLPEIAQAINGQIEQINALILAKEAEYFGKISN